MSVGLPLRDRRQVEVSHDWMQAFYRQAGGTRLKTTFGLPLVGLEMWQRKAKDMSYNFDLKKRH